MNTVTIDRNDVRTATADLVESAAAHERLVHFLFNHSAWHREIRRTRDMQWNPIGISETRNWFGQ